MSGLFSILNIGTRGMSAQQSAINVTSHNIANANTDGYSRQTAVIETTTPFSMPSLNNAAGPGQLGTGAQVEAINRVRDTFLDYQIRNETSTQSQYQTRDTYLGEVQTIINGTSDTGIPTLMSRFYSAWQTLSTSPDSSSARTSVAQESSALTDELNNTYSKLQDLKTNTQSDIQNTVFQLNDTLNQIDKLNQQIKEVKVSGQEPNDLEDSRDLLLDKLSSDFNLNVDKKNLDGIDVEPADTSGLDSTTSASLVSSSDPADEKRFSYINSIQETAPGSGIYNITYYKNGDMTSNSNKVEMDNVALTSNQYKTLDENRVLWADNSGTAIDSAGNEIDPSSVDFSQLTLFTPSSGSLKGGMSVQSDIDDYTNQLNSLAKTLALTVNAIHSGQADPANDSVPFFVNKDVAAYNADGSLDLTSYGTAESEITAGNITVNSQIMNDVSQIKTRTNDNGANTFESDDTIDGSSDGARALAIAQLQNTLLTVQNVDSTTDRAAFINDNNFKDSATGLGITNNANGITMDNYFKDTVDKLAVQVQQADRIVTNQTSLLSSLTTTKESQSGVSIDEEMVNLIQYQHAYQANAKVISTVNDLLDVVINGLIK